jgi:hypothetical protein
MTGWRVGDKGILEGTNLTLVFHQKIREALTNVIFEMTQYFERLVRGGIHLIVTLDDVQFPFFLYFLE